NLQTPERDIRRRRDQQESPEVHHVHRERPVPTRDREHAQECEVPPVAKGKVAQVRSSGKTELRIVEVPTTHEHGLELARVQRDIERVVERNAKARPPHCNTTVVATSVPPTAAPS